MSLALAATLGAAPGIAEAPLVVAVKAVLLFNFAKFADWPALAAGDPIVFCVVGDDGVAAALVETLHGQNIGGHALNVSRPLIATTWHVCHLLFIADAETHQAAPGLARVKTLPVLTISDGKGFSREDGIIELYMEGERMRFAINVDAAERSGLHLSARLLTLAKIIRNADVR